MYCRSTGKGEVRDEAAQEEEEEAPCIALESLKDGKCTRAETKRQDLTRSE